MWNALRTYLRYTSWPILAAMIALVVMGIVAIHVSEPADSDLTGFAAKQWKFALVGLAVFIGMTLIPYQKLGQLSYLMFAATLVMLAGIFLLPSVRGSHRWIDAGPIKIQPSEIAKFTFIIMLAWYLRHGEHYRRLAGLILPFLLTLVPMGLILLEPDLGTGMLFPPTLFFMLFMAGARLRHLVVIVAMGLFLVLVPVVQPVDKDAFLGDVHRGGFVTRKLGPVTFYSVDESREWTKRPAFPLVYCRFQVGQGGVYDLQPLSLRVMMGHDQTAERAQRVTAWLRPDDPRMAKGKGYQPRLARRVLASGGWTGRGDWGELDRLFRVLPDDHTDFIFCVIGAQWGFLGCAALLFLYGVIFVFGVEIASITYDPFARLLAVGVLALLFSQIVINVGMTMGLTPVTGMTLPLVSYGGSSLVVNCAALGLLVNVGQRRPILLSRRPFEFGARKDKPPSPYSPVADGAWAPGISDSQRDR
jgi:rod shape determining protein RodA